MPYDYLSNTLVPRARQRLIHCLLLFVWGTGQGAGRRHTPAGAEPMKLTEIVLLRVEGGEMAEMTLAAFSWIRLCRRTGEICTTSIVQLKNLCKLLNQQ